MSTSLTPETKLDAVNRMLGGIGLDPVNSLINDKDADVATALQTLQRVSRDVQTKGWDFNTDYDYRLSRNNAQEAALPKNILSWKVSHKNFGSKDLVERKRKLYDRKKQSFKFDGDIHIDVIFFFDFEDIPSAARSYISTRAAREFVADTLPNEMGYQTATQEETQAHATFLREHSITKTNMLRKNTQRRGRYVHR
jgi:hypothetical protein